MNAAPDAWHDAPMEIHFLGGATTVTGSQFLLVTDQARILIDCGMFQGGPNESVRNRVPLGFDPKTLDAILLTHAHLDHCGLIPHVIAEGFAGPVYATSATVELAELVLLDSGHLQEEFAKREARWERRHPDEAVLDDQKELEAYQAAVKLAEEGEAPGADAGTPVPPTPPSSAAAATPPPAPDAATIASEATSEEAALATDVGAGFGAGIAQGVPVDHEHDLRSQPPHVDLDLDEPLYTVDDAKKAMEHFRPIDYDAELEVAPGIRAVFQDAGHILGSAMIRVHVAGRPAARSGRSCSAATSAGPNTPIIRDPTIQTAADYVLVESTYGGREHEPQDEANRILAETVRLVAEHERRAARAVVRDRPDAGGRLAARPDARARRDPDAAALPRLADGVEGDRHLPPPPRGLRRGDREAPARRRHAARLPQPDRDARSSPTRRRSPTPRGRT